ncbi:G5 domain-containing protein [Jiangella anatolica]|uniref:G5 domain-containing protein n=1 Tax=Jiangella anatolica TaxID=2670374 RepID=UPI0018F4628D|nr:G5 domain-containing protein [Jiangella anatolica]
MTAAACGSGDDSGDRPAPLAAAPSSAAAATPSATPSATPTPVVTVETVTQTEAVPFERVTVEDATMDLGTSAVTTAGVEGVRTLTYEVTLTDGVETDRALVGDEVTAAPVDEVTSIGTYEPPPEPEDESVALVAPPAGDECDPNYSGCVPIDTDVDCAGGSGNGPSYADGPVTVTGEDIYGLDSDDDGVGCEP